MEHGKCGYAPLSKVFELETKRLAEVEPAQQEREFKKMTDALATMDTLGGGTVVVTLPGQYVYSSFEVDQKLMKNYPGLKARIECPIQRVGTTCELMIDADVVSVQPLGKSKAYFYAFAYASKVEITASKNPSMPDDIKYYFFPSSDIKSLQLGVTHRSPNLSFGLQ